MRVLTVVLALSILNNPMTKIESARNEAVNKINSHLVKHTDCELKNLIPIIESIEVRLFDGDDETVAFEYKGILFLNKNLDRSTEQLIITFIHEAYHKSGRCGEDINKNNKVRICLVLDKPVYYSTDINKHIRNHLRDY